MMHHTVQDMLTHTQKSYINGFSCWFKHYPTFFFILMQDKCVPFTQTYSHQQYNHYLPCLFPAVFPTDLIK